MLLEIKCYHCDKYHDFDIKDSSEGHVEYRNCDCGYGVQVFFGRYGKMHIDQYEDIE